MSRCFSLAAPIAMFLACTFIAHAQDSTKPLNLKITGHIVESDAKDSVKGMPCKVHVVKLQKDRTYVIDMLRTDDSLDPYLRLEDPAGGRIAEDDDSGGNLNARIRFTAKKDGDYKIIATTFAGGEGNYTLVVRDVDAPAEKQPAKEPAKQPAVVPSTKTAEPIKLDVLTAKKHWIEVEGRLQKGDALDPDRKQLCKNYVIELKQGTKYVIDMKSPDIDSYLRLLDPAGNEVANDDDSGGELNSRIEYEPKKTGVYRIVTTSFEPAAGGGIGDYQLKVAMAVKAAAGDKELAKGEPKGEPKAQPKEQPKAEPKGEKLATPTEKKPLEIDGKLNEDDPIDADRNQQAKKYDIELDEGVVYQIDLVSDQFDAFLRLLDAKGKQLAEDDDADNLPDSGVLNARIAFLAPAKGTYRIVATAFNADKNGGLGDFKLTVKPIASKAVKHDAKKVHELAAVPLAIVGRLTKDHEKDAVKDDSPCEVSQVKLVKGKTYLIDLHSVQMDSFLRIENADKKSLADDDDSGGMLDSRLSKLDSRLSFTPTEDGVYRIVATNLQTPLPNRNEGDYLLTVREKK